jgi:hypothetical protein
MALPGRRKHFPLLVDPQLAAIESTMETTVAWGRSMIGTPVSHEPQPAMPGLHQDILRMAVKG